MPTTRRSFLVTSATLLAAPFASAVPTSTALSASDVINRIKSRVGIPWSPDTVDRIVAGTADTPIKRIAVTMMATLDVLQRAAAAGCNLVITHEPTFFSHLDTTADLQNDPTFQLKKSFIAAHNLVIFRFHDHWHSMTPDGINLGMTRELGWTGNVVPGQHQQFAFPPSPLHDFAEQMATRLDAHSIRVAGDPGLPIRHVAANWGYASLMPELITVAARPDIDLLVVGETREWELVEYVEDQIASGLGKALIVLNHVVSEQAGMKYCADWLKPIVPEIPVDFVPTREPFRTL